MYRLTQSVIRLNLFHIHFVEISFFLIYCFFSKASEEMEMAKQDKNEADRLTAKNSVEEYIYEIRGKLCEELEDFMLEEDRNKFSLELEDAENWLYEDGEYAEKVEYSQKLTQLKSKGEAVKKRRYEFNERPGAINQFGQCLQLAQKAVDSFKVSFICIKGVKIYTRYFYIYTQHRKAQDY